MSLLVGRSVECMNIHPWQVRQEVEKQTQTPELMMMQSMIRTDNGVAPETNPVNGDSNRKRHIIRIKLKKPQQFNQDHVHDPIIPLVVESKSVDYQTNVNEKLKEKDKESQIQKQSLTENGEVVNVVAIAKRAADMVAMKRLSTTDPEFCRALSALSALKNFSVSYDSLKSTRVVKSLELLTKHPKVKIRTEAANVLQSWKKAAAPLEASTRSPIGKPKVGDCIQKESTVNIPYAFDIVETKVKKAQKETPKQTCNMREKIREHLVEALSKVVTEVKDEATKAKAKACDPRETAALIESTMSKMGQSHCNMAKQRSILFNLRDPNNPELRRRVLLGEIRPENLVGMTAEEMASNKRKRENEEIRLRSLIRSDAVEEEEGTTDQFKCERCGQRKCTYYQLQTRSADEPMTTFVRCVVCYNRWKF